MNISPMVWMYIYCIPLPSLLLQQNPLIWHRYMKTPKKIFTSSSYVMLRGVVKCHVMSSTGSMSIMNRAGAPDCTRFLLQLLWFGKKNIQNLNHQNPENRCVFFFGGGFPFQHKETTSDLEFSKPFKEMMMMYTFAS